MNRTGFFASVLAGGLTVLPFAALAQDMITDAKGMTLYVFDKDSGGVSACYDDCAVKWPPYLAAADAALTEGWTLVDRTDGTKQLAYAGKPMYFYVEDMAAGDAKGDGVGGVWHIVKKE